ncbi:hemoglobin/transferrin/lactoferrin receptor protein [Pasteurella multocida]|uniref:TonB-dependent hemoglobin/transferrin/lactoferrin family receptor n=1 Tax=Pasteurella multocida TaxID=747 RepID=UPI0008E879DF|nr:TonB-dependent hemoglobin/transferrin/lactoferrin family receptor [Pasteurella multocida]MDT8780445.1 TonB-dependent hemoglobin/transferrin/lactoferrin family receptor [Pasteurella multocida]SFP19228.1 hemoglobin/transferrin/lactoferrin receptor protein [Pasteurella multocida]SQI49117.1 hemoglobin-binding protein A [Pasteurella multocida]VEE38502.1 hemoglobin-binding protein A [Pasteurella multocida subsp. gallicida]HDR1010959.1 TonB-dependent hemoglobin/transferrin/lactoferrin family recep
MRTTTIKFSAITLALLSYCGAILADSHQEATELDTITVSSQQDEMNIKEKKVGETVKTASQLKRQQVQDSRDLVRYETGVTVVEAGRFGSSGYAIRGVDENRVAITVDGLHQAETLSSQGFKELFEGYGNFNNTRNSVEIETLKQAKITKGADSIKVGSGGLGGSVIFETKDARDYLIEKDWHIGYRTGYSTSDNQELHSVTLAGRYKWFDALIIKTKRHGHEIENYDYKIANDGVIGRLREKTDPYKITKDSTLVKFSFQPNENHRFTIMGDIYDLHSEGQDLSYSLQASKTQPDAKNTSTRHTNDSSKRKNYGFSYENYSSNLFWDTLKLSYSEQKITNKARTDDYCDERTCQGPFNPLGNPLGLQLKDGKIVDKEGNPLNIVRTKKTVGSGYVTELVDSKGKAYPYPAWDEVTTQDTYWQFKRANDYWFDCSVFDCNKITYYKVNYSSSTVEQSVATDKELEKVEQNGKVYARVASYSHSIVLPRSKGYVDRQYSDRDLNTSTKQLNLDLTKNFNLLTLENTFSYGALMSKTEKSMVNKSGYDGKDPQWWADSFLGKNLFGQILTCETSNSFNGNLCPKEEVFSFLIPVVSKNRSIYFNNTMKINNYLSFDLGYRYDRIKYQPNYSSDSPKIPDDMVKELFIPFVGKPLVAVPPAPKWWDYPQKQSDPKFIDDLAAYNAAISENKKIEAENVEARKQNARDNINYFAQNKKYKSHSYSFTTTIDPTDFIKVQLKYSKGFRAPTSDEVYFTFKHPDFSILPNVNLKPEIAKTQEIALTFYGRHGFITTSAFKTKYHDFIDLKFIGVKNEKNQAGGQARAQDFLMYQNINRQNAKVTGFEINSKLYLGELVKILNGFNLSYKYTHQKGRVDGNIPMNAIQPHTAVYGLGYQYPDDKFGIDIYWTKVNAKEAKDTYDMFSEKPGIQPIKWRSDSYSMVDLVAYAKPIKNITLQFGVYNLTDRKYLTWDSARSIRPFGTSNLINQKTGEGINRFYSPGRNYKLNAEITF